MPRNKKNLVLIVLVIICINGFILFPKISDETIKYFINESEVH